MIFDLVQPKRIQDQFLTGVTLLDLVKGIVDKMNQGDIPIIKNTWNYVQIEQNRRIADNLINQIESIISELEKQGLLIYQDNFYE